MAVTKKFTPPSEKKKIKLDINSHVLKELELYVECGQEEYSWLTMDIVVEQLLEDTLKKDRSFRSWLKNRNKAEKDKAEKNHIPNQHQALDSSQYEQAQP